MTPLGAADMGRRSVLRLAAALTGGGLGVSDARPSNAPIGGPVDGLAGGEYLVIDADERRVLRTDEKQSYRGVLWDAGGILRVESGAQLTLED